MNPNLAIERGPHIVWFDTFVGVGKPQERNVPSMLMLFFSCVPGVKNHLLIPFADGEARPTLSRTLLHLEPHGYPARSARGHNVLRI